MAEFMELQWDAKTGPLLVSLKGVEYITVKCSDTFKGYDVMYLYQSIKLTEF